MRALAVSAPKALRSIGSMVLAALLLTSGIAHGQTFESIAPGIFRVDAKSSDIRLLIYRAGPLARLGHNHVISVGDMRGTIRLRPAPEQSNVEIVIPVDELIVDDPVMRAEEGEAFSTEPTKTDINRTRANMLGRRVLNATPFPAITIRGTVLFVDERQANLNLSVAFLGRVIELIVPVSARLEGDELEASGALTLTHGELGLAPFSTMLGALRVAEEMDLKFRIRAHRE